MDQADGSEKTYLLSSVDLSTSGLNARRVVEDVGLIELRGIGIDLLLLRAAGGDLVLGLSVDVGVLDGLVLNGDLLFLGGHVVGLSES